ncbi:MAG: DUF1501 domain-containing protein [Burkholderiaceae bacterium]
MTARRRFLKAGGAALTLMTFSGWARAATEGVPRLLVLLELRGGNDGLNTVAPIEDSRYHDLRPRLALQGDGVVALGEGAALHPALAALAALWDAREMTVIRGVGYPRPNLSHFRSIEIWDTAADSAQYLHEGWLTRAIATAPVFRTAGADGVVIGATDLGPLGGGARAIALADPARFARPARLAAPAPSQARGARAQLLRVESAIARAAAELRPDTSFATEFPRGPFGLAIRHAAEVLATRRVPVVRITLAGFDTHRNQADVHAELLRQLAEGVVALRAALVEADLWRDTLALTYSEFGRRPRENASGGTDHGTASVMFAFGPRVAGGFVGEAPSLARLDADGNLLHTTDFRAVYATVLERWWNLDSERVLGARFAPLPLLRA